MMTLKAIVLFAALFSAVLLGMDAPPEYARLRGSLRSLPEGADSKDIFVEACSLGYVDLVSVALSRPETKSHLYAGLVEASAYGQTKVVELLMEDTGSDLDQDEIWRCLYGATVNGHTETLRLLLSNPRIGPGTNIGLLLSAAIDSRHPDIIRMLGPLANQSEITKAWIQARSEGNFSSAKALLSFPGANPTWQEHTNVFEAACEANDVEVVKSMLEGCVIEPVRYFDPAFVSVRGGTEIVKLLLQDPRTKDTFSGEHIETAVKCGHMELLKILINGIDLPEEFSFRRALITAVEEYHFEIAKFLLNMENNRLTQADLTAALEIACKMCSYLMTKVLLADSRCEIEALPHLGEINIARTFESVPCAGDLNVEIFDSILAAGANNESFDEHSFKYGILNDACATGNVDIVKTMFERRLFKTSLNEPLYLAVRKGHGQIANLIMGSTLYNTYEILMNMDKFGESAISAKILFSIAGKISGDMKESALLRYLTLGHQELDDLELSYLTPEKLEILVGKAKQQASHRAYKVLLGVPGCDESLRVTDHLINLPCLVEDIVHVKAGRIDKIPPTISTEDIDVFVFHVKSTEMAQYLMNLQIEHIKQYDNFTVNEQTCNSIYGSEDCREHVKNYIWPMIDSLAYFLKKLRPMRTTTLEAILTCLIILKESGWTDSQLHIIADGLRETLFD